MQASAYYQPRTVDEAIAVLRDPANKPFAGGSDIIVMLREGRRDANALVDLKRIAELTELRYDPNVGLSLGAAVSCTSFNEAGSPPLDYSALGDSSGLIGGIAIQNRAAIGGNLCSASPAGDAIPSLVVLNALCIIAGPEGKRSVPAEDFCIAPGRTVLREGELLVSIAFPPKEARTGSAFLRFIPRNEMDIAVASAAAWVKLSDDFKTLVDARVAIGAVAPTVLLVKEAAAALIGRPLTTEVFAEAAQACADAAKPISDVRGSAKQRTHLAGVMARRAIKKAVARALIGY